MEKGVGPIFSPFEAVSMLHMIEKVPFKKNKVVHKYRFPRFPSIRSLFISRQFPRFTENRSHMGNNTKKYDQTLGFSTLKANFVAFTNLNVPFRMDRNVMRCDVALLCNDSRQNI